MRSPKVFPLLMSGCFVAAFLATIVFVTSQRVTAQQVVPPVDTIADTPTEPSNVDRQEAAEDASHSERTIEMVREAISASDLRPFKKRRMLRRLRNPTVAAQVSNYVTANAIHDGIIAVPPPVFNPDGSVQEVEFAIDWDGLIGFIERLMPLILQLIALFGG